MKPCTYPLLVAALAGALPVRVHADDDLANERPVTTRAALEQHWGIDCTVLAKGMLAWTDTPGARPAADWPRQLRLCAAIHNTPGDPSAAGCPDYAAAADALAGAAPGEARDRIRRTMQCTN